MAKAKFTPAKNRRGSGAAANAAARRPKEQPAIVEVIDPRWVLKALLITIAAAVVCAYLALCLLVYQGSWQFMLKPATAVTRTPAAAGLKFDDVRFDAGTTGVPRLAGWWIPGSGRTTLLLIHDGHGSLADTVELIAALHATGADVFAFDYRGFGLSEATRPGEAKMTADTAAAFTYLTDTRHLAAKQIVPIGLGLGAALAAGLVHAHPELPGLIVDNPDPAARNRVLASEQSRLLPVSLLLHERFDLGPVLADTRQPKLLIVGGSGDAGADRDQADDALFRTVPDPKMTVVLPSPRRPDYLAAKADQDLADAVSRFLDQNVPGRTAGTLPLTAQ